MVARRRLVDLLTRSSEGAVLVIAPPGYGKSTLLLEYVQTEEPNAKWLTVTASDLEGFVRELIAVVDPRAVRGVGALFDGANPATVVDSAKQWLVARLRRTVGAIVIDDLHRTAGEPAVAELLTGLIEATRERNRWILASRESPKLPIASWIARGWMALPITDDELAFRPDEAEALAADLGVTIDAASLRGLIDDTGGWPLGLRISLDLWSRRAAREPIRLRTQRVLFDYIDAELWSGISERDRDLVFACSLLPSPSVTLLRAAGYPDAAVRLDDLCTALPFIRRQGADEFVIHDLFREYLVNRLRREPERIAAIGSRLAAELFLRHRRAEALSLYLAIGNVEKVRELLAVDAFELIETGHRPAVMRAVELVAANGYPLDPVVLTVRGATAQSEGNPDSATALYTEAIAKGLPVTMRGQVQRRLAMMHLSAGNVNLGLAVLGPESEDRSFGTDERCEVASVRCYAYALLGRTSEARRMSEELVPQLTSTSLPARVRVLQRIGTAAFHCGDFASAERLCLESATLSTELGLDYVAAWAYHTLCVVTRSIDDNVRRAIDFSRRQHESAERAGHHGLRVHALRNELGLCLEAGDFKRAQEVEALLLSLPDGRAVCNENWVRTARATIALANGEPTRAYSIMSSVPLATLSSAERPCHEAVAAIFAIIADHREYAIAVARRPPLAEAAEDFFTRRYLMHAYAWRGLLLWALDRPAQARRAFALDFSFLPEREQVLLETLRETALLPHPVPNREAIDELCARLERSHHADSAVVLRRLVDHDAAHVELTPAELEILRAFDRHGGSAHEVAEALGKSRYTVQNQIQAAIKKIGCSGRAEALAYARRRGWLQTHS